MLLGEFRIAGGQLLVAGSIRENDIENGVKVKEIRFFEICGKERDQGR